MESLWSELRPAVRSLAGAPGFATAAVLTLALLSSYLPARRASRVDPVVALRAE